MKKYASLLLFALLLNGCDDGDLTVETFNFDQVSIQSCSDTHELLYKLKSQESLLLQLPLNTLKDEVKVQEFDLSNTAYKLLYRTYNGTVATANICDAIRPATPNVTDEWNASNGTIIINTKETKSENTTENSTRITGYIHTISFDKLTFLKPGVQIGPDFVFGSITTTIAPLNLTFPAATYLCTESPLVYNFNDVSSLTISDIDPDLIANVATTTPRTGLISATKNKVSYTVYSGAPVTKDYFCKTTTPSNPVITQTWKGQNGIDGKSGIIEVTTSTLGPKVFKHVIVLKNVILDNGNVNFMLGKSFLLGELTTTSTN